MADSTIKPDSGNDLVLQNNGGGTKIEIPNSGNIAVTGTLAGNVTVGSGETLDVSSGTLTLADDQISGDKISGGTIGAGTFNGEIGSSATGFTGAKIIDQWRLTTTFTGIGDPIATNLERNDSPRAGFVGSAMTNSSGVFAFPSTGLYLIFFNTTHSLDGDNRYIATAINRVLSGSASIQYKQYTHIHRTDSNWTYVSTSIHTVFDCTDTTNDKVSFSVRELGDTSTGTMGDEDLDYTRMTFIRLGDT